MFQKFGKDIPQSLVDMVSGIMSEAKSDEPAAPDADAIARRKRLQAIKDKQEDDAAERGTGEKKSSGVRQVAGKAYGGAKQKDDKEEMEESAGTPGPVRKQVPSPMEKPSKEDMAAWHAKQKEKHAYKKEEVVGGQKKLDKNHNGKLDSDDFKKLRKNESTVDHWENGYEHARNAAIDAGFAVTAKHRKSEILSNNPHQKGSKEHKDWHEGAKAGHEDGVHDLMGESTIVNEILTKNTPIKTWIKDFVHSKNSKFSGKSKEERSKMAQGAFYGKQKEEVEQVVEYAGQPKDVPFDADKPHAPVAKAGKEGYGPSAAKHLAKQGLKKFLKKETLMGKAGCTSEEADLEESRGHKILATKLKQIDRMSTGNAPDHNTNSQSTRDKLNDADNIKRAEIVTQKDTSIKESAESDFHPDVHAELKKHTGKIGAIMHNTKDNAIAAVVHHPDAEGIHGPHHVHFFMNDKKVHTSVHPTFGDAEAHAVHTITTKSGLKHLGKMHKLMEESQIDELSKPMLATYIRRASDPGHPKSNVNLSSLAAHKLASGNEKDDGEKEDKKAYNRSRGIGLAAAKMAREESQIDELSDKTLTSYTKKAGKSFNKSYDLATTAAGRGDMSKFSKHAVNMAKRAKGIATADKKLGQEALYDAGQKGTQDIDTHMSPGATARG